MYCLQGNLLCLFERLRMSLADNRSLQLHVRGQFSTSDADPEEAINADRVHNLPGLPGL